MHFTLKKFLPLSLSLLFVAILYIAVGLIKESGYHLTYSATSSMPKGLYLVVPAKEFSQHDVVEFIPPQKTLDFLKDKNWIPKSSRIIKYVFAVPDDIVCIYNEAIWVNGKKIGPVHKFYAENKLLPQTKICGTLNENEYMLLSAENERSFDSRYFGAIEAEKTIGRAIPIFTF